MKRFLFSILFVAVFCIGLAALADKAGANFKSDEKALALIQKARLAIGGDSTITSVQSIVIAGKTTRIVTTNGVERSEIGETEIAMQLPDKLMKMVKIGSGKGEGMKQVNVVAASGEKGKVVTVDEEDDDGSGAPVKTVVIKKADGTVQEFIGAEADKIIAQNGDGAAVWTSKDGKTVNIKRDKVVVDGERHSSMKHNEMLRLTLSLLITAPQGIDVSYKYGGEASVDGTACNIVNAEFAGATFKLFLGQTSNLPVMMTYTGMKMPMIMKFKSEGTKSGEPKDKEHTIFLRKADAHAMETAEFNVKFSDYRAVNGVQLPFKWTQTVGGAADETFDVTSYDINPANIADRFQHQKVMVRTAKPALQ